jgi:hypothetical protein
VLFVLCCCDWYVTRKMERFIVKLKRGSTVSTQNDQDKRPRLECGSSKLEESHTSKNVPNTNCISDSSPSPKVVVPKETNTSSITIITDLSTNCDAGPTQPKINFPKRIISGSSRSFSSTWYEKFFWLEYSLSKDAVFCFVCRHFSVQKAHEVLINSGYSDWKNFGKMCDKHESSNSHKTCLSKYKGWMDSKKTGAVTTKINDQVAKEIEKNRDCLKSIVRSVLFCARQNIALRGHREVKQRLSNVIQQEGTLESSDDSGEEGSEQSEVEESAEQGGLKTRTTGKMLPLEGNSGNFKELVNLLCLENETLNKNIQNMPKNAKYTSKDIQADILTAASNIIVRNIVEEIRNGSKFYSLIIDEARDEGQKEQMSICCRYVLESGIRERFLGFVQLTKLDATALANKIKDFLNCVGLNIQLCVSQSYDGASVMSGKFNGVQALVREMTGNPCPYLHCHAHRLNLVLVDVSKHVQSVNDTIGLLEAIYAFQSASTLRNELFSFEVKTKSGTKKLKVPQHSDTRWVSKYKGVHFFKTQFTSVVEALQKCAQNKAKPKEAAEAKGLLTQFRSFDVIFFLVCLDGRV